MSSPESPSETPGELPAAVKKVSVEGKTSPLYLLGTAHVSRKSVEEVEQTLNALRPEMVGVELCASRLSTIDQRDAWQKLDIFQVIKQGKAGLLLSSLLLTSFQKRIGEELGVEPGAEMKQAIQWARANDAEILLIDRDVQVTLRRTWAQLGMFTRIKAMFQLIASFFMGASIEEADIEALKEEGQLEDMLASLAKSFPEVKSSLIDERDIYMAETLRQALADPYARTANGVVAVIGAGHLPGITEALGQPAKAPDPIDELKQVPPPTLWPRLLKWGIPLLILALIVFGFWRAGLEHSLESLGIWVVINGALAALGVVIALGHPLTVLAAFIAAPLTSLNPMVAAGWVAGLVQAWLKRPTVRDLEDLPEALNSVRGFWTNPVTRILLVAALANLGSMFGTFLGGTWVAARVLGQ